MKLVKASPFINSSLGNCVDDIRQDFKIFSKANLNYGSQVNSFCWPEAWLKMSGTDGGKRGVLKIFRRAAIKAKNFRLFTRRWVTALQYLLSRGFSEVLVFWFNSLAENWASAKLQQPGIASLWPQAKPIAHRRFRLRGQEIRNSGRTLPILNTAHPDQQYINLNVCHSYSK